MEYSSKKKTTCSICGDTGHNKRSCPKKPIEDISQRDDTECVTEERVIISLPKEKLIDDLLDRQAYDIPIDIFTLWIRQRQCQQKEIRYVLDRGLNKNSVRLYLNLLEDIDELY